MSTLASNPSNQPWATFSVTDSGRASRGRLALRRAGEVHSCLGIPRSLAAVRVPFTWWMSHTEHVDLGYSKAERFGFIFLWSGKYTRSDK